MRKIDDNKDNTHPRLVVITSIRCINEKILMVMAMMMILARGLKTVITQRTTGPRYSDNKATFRERMMMAFYKFSCLKGSQLYNCLLEEF